MKFAREVADGRRVHAQLDRLASRADARRLEVLVQDGVRFSQLLTERERVVAYVTRALSDASYRPGNARLARSFIAGKWREIARLGALDLVVHSIVSDVLGDILESHLSSRVYSYRKERSSWDALRWLSRVARAHVKRRPDPKTRGIYVLRSDIRNYAPSIPLYARSPIWPELLAISGLAEDSPHWTMLRALILQPLVSAEGEPLSRDRGVLFGAPTSNALMNMYLRPLDDALSGLRGAYARFGDDVLFAHANPDVVKEAIALTDRVLAERDLSLNHEKLHILYWNGAARPSDVWQSARPSTIVPFLGAAVGFDGTISLATAKWNALLRDLRGRIRRTSGLLEETDPQTRARILASVVNEAFAPHSDLGLPHKQMTLDLVSNRSQLAQLDYWLARWLAEAATGKMGPATFRHLPYRWLREEAGLVSRVVARNHAR